MDVTPLVKSGQHIIQSYAGGRFRVGGLVYEHSIIVTPEKTWRWGFSGGVDDLSVGDFETLCTKAQEIDVVLLGCGSRMRFLPPKLRTALKEQGLSVDIMATDAACRTYNVLMAEGRRVAAALLPF